MAVKRKRTRKKVVGHGPSIKAPRVYEALRRKGYSKTKAARISNASANGSLNRKRRKKR